MIEQQLARKTLKIMKDNVMRFDLNDDLRRTINSLFYQKTEFTEEQLSYIDGVYEKYMKAGGFPSISVKHDYK